MNQPLAGRRPAEILIVEDNPDDVFLLQDALQRIPMPVHFHHVENGQECLAFLRREGAYAGAPRPDLILLDLNMPLMDGRQVLATLVADPQLRSLPVVVLTTSAGEPDIELMYELRCSSYIVKPLELAAFEQAIRLLCEYWFGLATLPSRTGEPDA